MKEGILLNAYKVSICEISYDLTNREANSDRTRRNFDPKPRWSLDLQQILIIIN